MSRNSSQTPGRQLPGLSLRDDRARCGQQHFSAPGGGFRGRQIKPLTASAAAQEAKESAEIRPKPRCIARPIPSAERLVDLHAPIKEDVELQLLRENDPEALKVLRHSAAHVMATAVLELFPETKLGHGPATDAGFSMTFSGRLRSPPTISRRSRRRWPRWWRATSGSSTNMNRATRR